MFSGKEIEDITIEHQRNIDIITSVIISNISSFLMEDEIPEEILFSRDGIKIVFVKDGKCINNITWEEFYLFLNKKIE